MSFEHLPLVAFDSGIYHAGLFRRLSSDRSLSPLLITFAIRKQFRLLVLDTVNAELASWGARHNREDWVDEKLLAFFEQCHFEWPPRIPSAELDEHRELFHRLLRHGADAPVAAEVHLRQPDYFVHTNPEHWGRLVHGEIGQTRIVSPRQFLRELGVTEIPEPRRPNRRRVEP